MWFITKERITAAFDWEGVVAAANYRIDAWVNPPVYTGRAPVMLQGLRTTFAKGATLLTDAEARAVGEAFSTRMMAKKQADDAGRAGPDDDDVAGCRNHGQKANAAERWTE